MRGVVRRTGGGVYLVALEDDRRVEATLRGRVKLGGARGAQVVIGDRVEVEEAADDAFVIAAVLPRDRELVRRGKGGRQPKVLAANVERMVLVLAARNPEPRLEQVDRFLVVGEANGLEALLVVNKMDLEGAETVAESVRALYGDLGYEVRGVSALTGQGLESAAEVLCRGRSVLVGPSGVGKTSLLNAIQPGLDLRVGELSRKRGTGRHTTVSSRLITLECGGEVADTPGFGDVGLWGVEPEALDRCFPELRPHLDGCRFRGCTHLHEPDCAVREALDAGEIDPRRFESYRALREEAEEAARPDWG